MRVLLLIPQSEPPQLQGEQWSAGFKEFVSLCLQRDAKQRPSAKELLTLTLTLTRTLTSP